MTRSNALLVLAFAGCGSVKNPGIDAPPLDNDADPDAAAPACDLGKPFSPALEIPNLHDGAANDTHATLSADERTLFFASDRGSPGTFHIHTSTRDPVTAPFSAPRLVGELFTAEGESHPSVSPDGNTLLFDSFRVSAGTVHIFTATRNNVAVEFGTPTLIPGDFLIDPAITTDGNVLYAANLSTGRLVRFEKEGGGFGAAQNASIPGGFSMVSPVTNDDLTMFLGQGDTVGAEIISTRRASLSAAFPEPTRVNEFKTSAVIAEPSWLSPDGCRLYLTYAAAGGKTIIHVATRPR